MTYQPEPESESEPSAMDIHELNRRLTRFRPKPTPSNDLALDAFHEGYDFNAPETEGSNNDEMRYW